VVNKTVEEIIATTPVIGGEGWDTPLDVFQDFEDDGGCWSNKEKEARKELIYKHHKGETILFAWYDTSNYEGTAFVLFEKDGELFEVYGSHCNYYGLECPDYNLTLQRLPNGDFETILENK
jgi:hypothetical protein